MLCTEYPAIFWIPVSFEMCTHSQQDWVAFISQPFWVEAKVEVELRLMLRLRLIWGCHWNEVEMRSNRSLVEIELRLSWVGVEIGWHWIKGDIGLLYRVGLWFKICFRSIHVAEQHMVSLSPSILTFDFI